MVTERCDGPFFRRGLRHRRALAAAGGQAAQVESIFDQVLANFVGQVAQLVGVMIKPVNVMQQVAFLDTGYLYRGFQDADQFIKSEDIGWVTHADHQAGWCFLENQGAVAPRIGFR